MRHKGMFQICLLLWVAASVQAVTIPVPLPAIHISTTPATPTTGQTFTLSLSGQRPDNCPPAGEGVSVARITVLLNAAP